jgi:hypothetical protein
MLLLLMLVLLLLLGTDSKYHRLCTVCHVNSAVNRPRRRRKDGKTSPVMHEQSVR